MKSNIASFPFRPSSSPPTSNHQPQHPLPLVSPLLSSQGQRNKLLLPPMLNLLKMLLSPPTVLRTPRPPRSPLRVSLERTGGVSGHIPFCSLVWLALGCCSGGWELVNTLRDCLRVRGRVSIDVWVSYLCRVKVSLFFEHSFCDSVSFALAGALARGILVENNSADSTVNYITLYHPFITITLGSMTPPSPLPDNGVPGTCVAMLSTLNERGEF